MRYNNPKMVFGLIDLCQDIRDYIGSPEIMFEIGCYSGESTQIFWENLCPLEMHCVDKWSKTDKYSSEDISYAEKLFLALNADKIKKGNMNVHKTHSRDVKFCKKYCPVDMVYIDASHHYDDVSADIDFWLPLMESKSVISGHDYSNKFPGVIKAVNERFGKPDKVYKDTSWIKFIE